MGLRDIGASLPPGFRFYPSDQELVCHYLYKKISNGDVLKDTLVEIDLHTCEPWQLPEVAKLNSSEWYFFSFRDRKYATGFRANRATTSGYWKATGKDRTVLHPGTKSVVGMRKTLVFYMNRAPNGVKTGWIMHEFRLQTPHLPPKEDWVLCRVVHKAKSTENSSDNLSLTYMDDTTFPTLATSPPPTDHDNTFATVRDYRHISSLSAASHVSPPQRSGNSNTQLLLNSSPPLERTYLQLPNSKCDDEQFGFLLDMSFGETNLKENIGVSLNLEEMQFDDDDNGMILF